jgi:hypothetical protein
VVLEDSKTLKFTKGGSRHGEIATIKENSDSSNNFMANSPRTGVINNNIIVSKNTNGNKNIYPVIKIEILLIVMIVVSFPH